MFFGNTGHKGAVDGAFIVKSIYKFPCGYRYIFQRSIHVGKLQADKFNILVLHNFKDLFFCVFLHDSGTSCIP